MFFLRPTPYLVESDSVPEVLLPQPNPTLNAILDSTPDMLNRKICQGSFNSHVWQISLQWICQMGSLYVNMFLPFLPFRPPCSVRCIVHGSLNVPMFHITQPLGISGLLDGYYKVMSNIPKSWDSYQPLLYRTEKHIPHNTTTTLSRHTAAPEVGRGVSCHPMTTCLSWSVGSLELEKSLIHSFEDKQV